MEQLFGSASDLLAGANLSSVLAILKLSTSGITLETLFQSLIDGLMKFVESFFALIQ